MYSDCQLLFFVVFLFLFYHIPGIRWILVKENTFHGSMHFISYKAISLWGHCEPYASLYEKQYQHYPHYTYLTKYLHAQYYKLAPKRPWGCFHNPRTSPLSPCSLRCKYSRQQTYAALPYLFRYQLFLSGREILDRSRSWAATVSSTLCLQEWNHMVCGSQCLASTLTSAPYLFSIHYTLYMWNLNWLHIFEMK